MATCHSEDKKTKMIVPATGVEQLISYPPPGRKHIGIWSRVFIKCSSDRKKSSSDREVH